MTAIEFQAAVRDGMIQIPSEYQSQFADGARVILMSPLPVSPNNILEQLLTSPVSVAGFYPLTRDEVHVR